MASVVDEGNGRKRIEFGPVGQRKPIRLGKVTAKQAEATKIRIERLVASQLTGHPDDETIRWVNEADDRLHAKLANAGLVRPRESTELGPWLEKFIDGLTNLKPESRRKLGQTKAKLLAFFPAQTSLRSINEDQAADWRQWLVQSGLSEAAVKIHSGNAKTIFAEAARRKLVAESPFRNLRSGVTRSADARYITPAEADAVIEALPTTEWKLLFGLARFAGLRVPSESHLLRWADVDWERGRLNVRSPKTERHPGHEKRTVPIGPKLMKLLQDRFAEAAEGEERLVTMRGAGHVRRTIEAAIKRAQVTPWDKLFQTCRASCEMEWAMSFPQFAVSKWLGHSITVSGRHYANEVPDELFEKAAHSAAQQAAESSGNGAQQKSPAETGLSHIAAKDRDLTQVIAGQQLGGGGNRTPVPR